MLTRLLLTFTLFLSSFFPAYAANVVLHENVLYIMGKIETGDSTKVHNILYSDLIRDVGIVVLDSEGGSLPEAQLISVMINDRQLDIGVDGICASACVNILMAGNEKLYLKYSDGSISYVGVHTPYYQIGRNIYEDTQYSSAWWLYYGSLRAGGLKKQQALTFLRKVYSTPSKDMYRFSEEELKDLGFISLEAE